jgi:hypothetical protein
MLYPSYPRFGDAVPLKTGAPPENSGGEGGKVKESSDPAHS